MPRDLKTAMVKPLLKKSNSNVISDKGKNVILILLNLSAAFDTVNHTFLLAGLDKHFGINGTVLNWFSSYLWERTHFVDIDQSQSSVRDLF